MSTRGIVGTAHDSGFRGRYIHMDSYPSGVGQDLLDAFAHFGDWEKVRDASLRPDVHGYWSNFDPQDGLGWTDSDEMDDITNLEDVDAEWAYLLDERGVSVVWARRDRGWHQGVTWVNVGKVAWSDKPEHEEWLRLQCGDDLERCTHYAWVHFPEAKDINIGTAVWMGRAEPGHHDVHELVLMRQGGPRLTVCGGSRGTADDPGGWRRDRSPGDRHREYWWVRVREHGSPIRAYWILKDGRYKLEPGINGIVPTAAGERLVLSGTVL